MKEENGRDEEIKEENQTKTARWKWGEPGGAKLVATFLSAFSIIHNGFDEWEETTGTWRGHRDGWCHFVHAQSPQSEFFHPTYPMNDRYVFQAQRHPGILKITFKNRAFLGNGDARQRFRPHKTPLEPWQWERTSSFYCWNSPAWFILWKILFYTFISNIQLKNTTNPPLISESVSILKRYKSESNLKSKKWTSLSVDLNGWVA